MIKKELLTFQFKENRNYVHGTDIFNETIKVVENVGLKFDSVSMSINAISDKNMTCLITDELVEMKDYAVRFDFQNEDKSYRCLLKQDDREIIGRYRYPENQIIDCAEIEPEIRKVTLSMKNQFTNIENVVALNKGLLEKLYPDIHGKWYFVKLDISSKFLLNQYNRLSLQLVKNMKFKLIKTDILFDGNHVGSLFFSLKN